MSHVWQDFPTGPEPLTLDAWGVEITWTVLGFTPLALGRLKRANLLFLRPLSPLGSAPLYLKADMTELVCSGFKSFNHES